MSVLKVWGQPRSINVQKVLWALEELELKYERLDVTDKLKTPEYLALNPNGLMPTLQDGDAALWESNAILRYLFARYGKAPLFPEDHVTRARADAWNEWHNLTFWANVRPLLVQLVRTPEDKRDRAVIESSQNNVHAALKILEGTLEKQPYVAGQHFTFGDLPLAAAAQRWFNLPLKRPETKAVQAWYARIKERPGFKKWIDLPLA
ncbi:MAG TPA: glutathione S-transferase family protein [Polyangiales bacterium]